MGTKRKAKPIPRKRASGGATAQRRWSQRVTQRSDAMDLEAGVFTQRSAAAVARSLKRSVERSTRRKSPPFRSAMSMLNFEINRAGKGMTAARKRTLNAAKEELRRLFGRPTPTASARAKARKKKTPARR